MQAATDPYVQLVQRIYIGYFGRPADPGGLAWYAARLRDIGAPSDPAGLAAAYSSNPALKALIDSFASSQESQDLYPAENAPFVEAVYINLFGREADTGGLAWWTAALDRGDATRANAMLWILASTQGTDSNMVALKAQMSEVFTTALNTAQRVEAYKGMAAGYSARAMLTQAFPLGNISIFKPTIETTIAQLEAAHRQNQLPYEEVAGGERRIALAATASQMAANGDKLRELATILALDLNQRDPDLGPKWKVDVIQAGMTVRDLRAQLKGYFASILIGEVPLSNYIFKLDLYRLPDCPLFRFAADGNSLQDAPATVFDQHPDCRNGQFVTLLHGRSPQQDIADVAEKLDQSIAYHRASAQANASWSRAYQFVQALWGGGTPWKDASEWWKLVPLFAPSQINYTNSGNAQTRLAAFKSCLGSTAEMCIINAHGLPREIQPEGPGTVGSFYSSDTAVFNADDIKPQSIGAKYVSLVSCSTQDPSVQNNLGAALLMSGKALLTHGMDSVALISDDYERLTLLQNYQPLAHGATFAEAFGSDLVRTPGTFQGDPFITMRSLPAGEGPRLAIDGKRYHGAGTIIPMNFPDSIARATVRKTVVLSNRGTKDLRVRSNVQPWPLGPDANSQDNPALDWTRVWMSIEAPSRLHPVHGVGTNINNDEYVIGPGESMAIVYKMQPVALETPLLKDGGFQGRILLVTNDPAAPRIVLELHANVKVGL